eukprot:TRINITY_DN33681_c0_g1_i1.p1 TRINITY_DN33681_c0_g1~~TRINITY_DN33681_c0_g1_i1.p1  ORF type:complete len:324 (+),score=122.48 TRINITY_DN33681_c0_g1_i1:156-1127(+)
MAEAEGEDKKRPLGASCTSLQELCEEVVNQLRVSHPQTVEGLSAAELAPLYTMPPFVPKTVWTQLGDLIKQRERLESHTVGGECWVTLRLDGSGFSKLIGQLRTLGVFEAGFSPVFAAIMLECVQALMDKFNGVLGYTQSDELTVLIPPAPVVRNQQQQHSNNGRVLKWCTNAASFVTALFNHRLAAHCKAKEVELPAKLLPTFDCRMGCFQNEQQATGLLLWRAYDSGVNGISDAVHQCKAEHKDAHNVIKKSSRDKLKWLHQKGLLPLNPLQANGALFAKVKRLKVGCDPRTNTKKYALRPTLEQVPGLSLIHISEPTRPY